MDGRYAGMVLNLTFAYWMQECLVTRERCIRASAVHEFGHALGFADEQTRSAPFSCPATAYAGTFTPFGEAEEDVDSVMYECADSRWRRGGRLTAYDVKGAALLYGDALWSRQFGADDSAGGWSVEDHVRVMGDVTGDGLPDIVGFGYAGVYVSKNMVESDFILPENGSFAPTLLKLQGFGYAQGWRVERHPRTVADVNGDGKADLIGFADNGVYVALSNGDGFGAPELWLTNFGYDAGQWRVKFHERTVGDVNGDGKADIVGFGVAGVYVSLSTGSSFGPSNIWIADFGVNQGWSWSATVRTVADVNGDNRADIIGFSESGVYVALANSAGTGFNPTQQWSSEFTYNQQWRVERHVRTVADVNGDNRADIVGFGETETRAALSTGSSFSASTLLSPDFSFDAGGWRVGRHPRFAVDLDADGRADLIGFGEMGEYVSLR
ncbi:FG-GAP-like repeat-containing protein [Myxococcus xanthus]|uniref:FG-GAP-like repeat-containing protein n=1 Tax=Myxococcus xanthus TaxID=34 RepID=UPI0020A392A2|nr:FG-GAP-like repeat-containing protein [Myxococcus xanthus]